MLCTEKLLNSLKTETSFKLRNYAEKLEEIENKFLIKKIKTFRNQFT